MYLLSHRSDFVTGNSDNTHIQRFVMGEFDAQKAYVAKEAEETIVRYMTTVQRRDED